MLTDLFEKPLLSLFFWKKSPREASLLLKKRNPNLVGILGLRRGCFCKRESTRLFMIGLFLVFGGVSPGWGGALPKADAVFPAVDMAKVRLGRLLFYDPLLSGGKTVSCASCHSPKFGTSDGLSLGFGDGGRGAGVARRVDLANLPEQRIARNAPALFNLGAAQFRSLFHDGRLERDAGSRNGLRTPLGEDMSAGFDSVLSAQAMFPVLAADEMAGHYSESDVSKAARQGRFTGNGGAWDILARRVAGVPAYRQDFTAILGKGTPIRFADIANMIAAFASFEWRADNSPFDAYLRHGTPMSKGAMRGMGVFYGKGGCDFCHSGQFQSDQSFHAIAMPQIGPGKAARFQSFRADRGRFRVTGAPEDAYRFRTPSLRNVTQTAPYGHDGAYATLGAVLRHHLDPVSALYAYDPAQAVLPPLAGADDFATLRDTQEMAAIAAANELAPNPLSAAEQADLLAFLAALSDPISRTGRLGVPAHVPSGLPLE